MSDNDVQDSSDTSSDGDTIEFSESHFDEPVTEASDTTDTDTPAEPATDTTAEKTDEASDTPENPEGDDTSEVVPETDTPDSTETEQSESELKGMTRAERAEYFQSLQQQQRKQVEQAIDENYQPQPVDELKQAYMDEGYDDFQATMLAKDMYRDQQLQIANAKVEIAELNSALATEAMDVVNSIDWLNSTNKETYDAESTEAASLLYEQLAIVKDDRTGQIIEAKISPKQFYQAIDKIRNSGSAKAGIKAQKAAEAQMASAAPPSSTAPPSGNESDDDKRAARLAQKFGV